LNWSIQLPAKIFVFGDLTLHTENSPKGQVSWWFHVAPIVRSGDDELWVLDPALESKEPIMLRDWMGRLNSNVEQLKISVCNGFAYAAHSSCMNSTLEDNSVAIKNQLYFLFWEWERQTTLGRDPERVLGDYPPWANEMMK
jgi:hypothetical protein